MKILPPPPPLGRNITSTNKKDPRSILGNPKKFNKITKYEKLTEIFNKLFQENELKLEDDIKNLSMTMIQASLEHVRIIVPPSTQQWDSESLRYTAHKDSCPAHEREDEENEAGLQITPGEAQILLSKIPSSSLITEYEPNNIFYQLFLKSLTSPKLSSRRIISRVNII
ncbi:hypothetical protein TCON_2118 [Astathelohania contejeani]|uniref:Uncharacterized protein n=1 Tax=Astathelohania contejeani TaxID=164912 RepID=A0ABQ7HX24_9MICR|nr:hypothetical protein TCON_2118 [Thelohania contejeani]